MTVDPLDATADALDALSGGGPSRTLLIDDLFGDRPDILDKIKAAKARQVSYQKIATALSVTSGRTVTDGAVRNWYIRQP